MMTTRTHGPGYLMASGHVNPTTTLRKNFVTGQTWNPSMWSDPELDRRIHEMFLTRDEAERQRIVKQITREMLDEAPYLWLPVPYIYTAWWPWVKNYAGELRAGAVRPGPDLRATLDRPGDEAGDGLSAVKEPLLRIDDLNVTFGAGFGNRPRVRAVTSLSLEVAPGETLAIVGESGSGKSVTALSILRLIPEPGRIESGRILFEGQDLLALDGAGIRSVRGNRIAMIFQEPMSSLNPVLTIGRQVAEPLRLHRRLKRREALERAVEHLKSVAIPDAEKRLGDYPHQFSGGMRQRVMIAMALACHPRLLIADEPTTALDVTVQAQILELLKERTREADSALILITHDLGVVARYADRVAVMYGGRIVESGPAAALYADPRHPYTQGLLRSVPRLEGDCGGRLDSIDGQPPDLAALPAGCAFAPRCPQVRDRCLTVPPMLEAGACGRAWACYGYEEGAA